MKTQVWLERLFKFSFVLQIIGVLNLLPNYKGSPIFFDPSLTMFIFLFNSPWLLAFSIYRLWKAPERSKWVSGIALLGAIMGFVFGVMVIMALKNFQ